MVCSIPVCFSSSLLFNRHTVISFICLLSPNNLPTGAIIATGQLTGCYEVTSEVDLREWVEGNEYDFGDYRLT